jgi:SAM-dependent methyltransferase
MTITATREGEAAPAESPAVQELARSLREGLERRRLQNSGATGAAPSPLVASETYHALHAHADLVAVPPVAKPGPLAWPACLLRRLCKPLIRPWLGVQTEFNRLTLEALQGLHQEIHVLKGEKDRPAELVEPPSQPGRDLPPGLVSARTLEQIFVHTRLPPPPARVLDLDGAESTTALEMASFGYQVAEVGRPPAAGAHPSLLPVRADVGRLPFAAEAFDVVVSLSVASDHRSIAEAWRVLRRGGRLILSVPYGPAATRPRHGVYDRGLLDAVLGSFRRLETLYGIRTGAAWSLTADGEAAERVSALALVVAEKP